MASQAEDVDGFITFDRYKDLVVEFFSSPDSATSARHIFGPMELADIGHVFTAASKQ